MVDLFSTAPAADPLRDELLYLTQQLRQANHAYYVRDQPTLTDAEYDGRLRRLRAIEAERPDLVRADSPTLVVGTGRVEDAGATGLGRARHLRPMLSLANAFSVDELIAHFARAEVMASTGELPPGVEYFGEVKLDGLSLALTYEHGALVRIATRGQGGVEGEDVTESARGIGGIPTRLHLMPGEVVPPRFEIRGEGYMLRSLLAKTNEERTAAGEKPFMNVRNAAAGTIRQHDRALVARRGLRFAGYALALPDDVTPAQLGIPTQAALYVRLQQWGVAVCPIHRTLTSLEAIEAFADEVRALRPSLDYDADGAVIKVNDLAMQASLGAVGREPRGAVARKWPEVGIVTTLRAIDIQVGRTGQQNPLARFDPVLIGGAMISNATLHNPDWIAERGLRLGDHIRVTRSGDVIPYVQDVLVAERTGSEIPWSFPATCVSCNTPTARHGAFALCTNLQCPAQLARLLEHAASRAALDIDGMAGATVERLLEAGLVGSVADVFALTEADLRTLPGFAETSAHNLVEAIAAARSRPVERVLFALGIPDIGDSTSVALINAFGSIDAIAEASADALLATPGIGPARVATLRGYFDRAESRAMLAELRANGVAMTPKPVVTATATGPLAWHTVVVTGTLDGYTRESIEAALIGAGAKVTGSVSRKTTALILGREAGSKAAKAATLGVPIVEEPALAAYLATGTLPAAVA